MISKEKKEEGRHRRAGEVRDRGSPPGAGHIEQPVPLWMPQEALEEMMLQVRCACHSYTGVKLSESSFCGQSDNTESKSLLRVIVHLIAFFPVDIYINCIFRAITIFFQAHRKLIEKILVYNFKTFGFSLYFLEWFPHRSWCTQRKLLMDMHICPPVFTYACKLLCLTHAAVISYFRHTVPGPEGPHPNAQRLSIPRHNW